MDKADSAEAAPIIQRAATYLLAAAPTRGRAGANLRTAIGALRANAQRLVQKDVAGEPLDECFDLSRKCGITQKQLSFVRGKTLEEKPKTLGATLIKNVIVNLCLAHEGRVIADMVFTNREQVEQLKKQMNEAFNLVEEVAADDMDQDTYIAMVRLHAAIIFHLTETARPLPRMLRFQFATPLATLIMSQRLYYDASRADELREENKVIHPAFARPYGRALSA